MRKIYNCEKIPYKNYTTLENNDIKLSKIYNYEKSPYKNDTTLENNDTKLSECCGLT